ncbi:MAG: peptidoglycan-binding protein [Deltaproteobacteria bacterium]|nr:peptidoglycan-binding protein [Deltaproteobacteria bacterium]
MSTINGKAPPSMHSPGTASPPSTPAQISPNLEKGLSTLQPGQPPKTTAEQVLTGLKGKGFEAPPAAPKDLGAQLAGALKQFQAGNGLPQTGGLDAKTGEALKNAGISGAPPEPAQKATKDDFERGAPSLLKQGAQQRADIAKNSTPDTNFLDALLNKLGGDQGVTSDKQGQVGGAAQTSSETAKSDQAKDVKKASEAESKSASTSEAKKASAQEQQQLDKAKDKDKDKLQVARGLKANETKTEEQRRKNALAGKDPTEKGILDEEADEEATEGDGGDGKKKGKGGDQAGGGHDAEASGDAGGAGAADGNEKSRGNAHSGDEDHGDPSRGHASVDDGSGDGPGHYKVGSLSEQAFAALLKIVKDPSATNKATTYSWDVVFFKPGVYGPGQKAQDLVHLVVTSATAFDPVWQKAQANLHVLIRKLERDTPVPTLDDILAALRQLRARDGGSGPMSLGKLVRPPGRA